MSQEIKDAATALAMWWSDIILNKPLNKDNGDDGRESFMLAALVSLTARNNMQVDREHAADAFEDALESELLRQYQKHGERGMSLDCDYAPCEAIACAMRAAGIPLAMAPWKTHTYVKDGHAYGKFGYGKDYVKII
jgi:hypothetical protein